MERSARSLLARKLRMLRFLHGWSQERLAEQSGLHRTYVSLIERAQCNISLDNMERIAAAFGLSLAELLALPDAALLGERLLHRPNRKDRHQEIEHMLIFTRTVGETIRIELDSKVDPRTPIRALFTDGPIEVLVTSIGPSEVRLGVSAPLALVAVKG